MPAITSLNDLLVQQLRDLYSAERQLVQALPKMARGATSEQLTAAITLHLTQTEEQVARLERAFEALGVSSRGPKCKAMEGLIEEGKEMLEEDIEPEVLDAGIIAAAQRVEHYEIAAYGTVCEFARALGHSEVLELLEASLAEEKQTDLDLTALALEGINQLAMQGADESDDEDDESTLPDSDDEQPAPSAARKSAGKTPAKQATRSTRNAKSGSRGG